MPFTKVNGKVEKDMVEEYSVGQMVLYIKGIGKMIWQMDMVD
jgi:hypothetical protein